MLSELEIIKQKISAEKKYLRDTFGVEEIGVFGSYAHGEATPTSDVDVIVLLNQRVPVGVFEFIDLQLYLEKKLGKRVDLVTKRGLRPAFRKFILPDIIEI